MQLRLFLLLTSLSMALASREPPWGDAHVVYDTSANLVEHGRLDVTLGGPPQFYTFRNGKKFGVFPLGNVIAMVPGYLLYKALAALPGAPTQLLYNYTCHLPPALLMAGACLLLVSIARRLGGSTRSATGIALAAGTTTILFVYARSPFSEALQTFAFTWVVDRTLALEEQLGARQGAWLGVALGLLFNTKLVYALVLPIPPLYLLYCHRQAGRHLVTPICAALAPLLLLSGLAVGHNYWKTGSLLDTGYQIPHGVFSGDAYAAFHGYFFSTGKSVFLYSPLLLLAVLAGPSFYRAEQRRSLFLLVLTGTVVLANAKFRHWHADYCWGPRLLVPLLPTWLAPVPRWLSGALDRGHAQLRTLGLGLLLGTGLFVQLLGSAFYWDHYIRIAIAVKDQTGADGWYGEDLHHCHFIPQFSPLVGHAWMLRHTLLGDDDILADAPWSRVTTGKVSLAGEWRATRPDLWAFDWFDRKSGARRWGAGLLALLSSLGAWSLFGLDRRQSSPDQFCRRDQRHRDQHQ